MTNLEEHRCPECNEMVVTAWSDRGLLPGDYVLAADYIFHTGCWDAVCDRYNKECNPLE